MKLLLPRLLLVGLLSLAGCRTAKPPLDYTPTLARFFLESSDSGAAAVILPQSGTHVPIAPKPSFTEGDIVNVELMQVELGKCLMFQLTPMAARDLYRLSGANQGRRLVLLMNNVAMGARRIDRPIADGAVLIFVEIEDAALPALVDNLKKTSSRLQREIARRP